MSHELTGEQKLRRIANGGAAMVYFRSHEELSAALGEYFAAADKVGRERRDADHDRAVNRNLLRESWDQFDLITARIRKAQP